MNKTFAFGDRIAFLLKKTQRDVYSYIEVSISKKKAILTQKDFQSSQLCWVAGKAGA